MKIKTLLSILIMSASLLMMNAVITGAQEDAPQVWISPETVQVQPGQEFTVAVNVADAIGVYGGSFKLVYDPQTLELVFLDDRAVTAGAFFDGQPSFMLKNSANVQEGVIEYALTLTQPAQPVTGGGALGTITFRALSEAAVNITPLEARLLSPEFTEVGGRLVAQSITEVNARLQGASIVVGESAPAETTTASAQFVSPFASTLNEPMIVLTKADVLVLAASGIFFIVGLTLFMMTVRMYSRLNVRPVARRSGQPI